MESTSDKWLPDVSTSLHVKNQTAYGFIHEKEKSFFWKYDGSKITRLSHAPSPLILEVRKTHNCACGGVVAPDGSVISLPIGAITKKISTWAHGNLLQHMKRFKRSIHQRKKAYAAFCVGSVVRTIADHQLSDSLVSLRSVVEKVSLSQLGPFLALSSRQKQN